MIETMSRCFMACSCLKILKSDESASQRLRLRAVALALRVRNPKFQIGLPGLRAVSTIAPRACVSNLRLSNFGFEMGFRPISKFPRSPSIDTERRFQVPDSQITYARRTT